MRLLKAALTGAIGLFIFSTIFSLLIPAKVRVSRVVLINNTNPQLVYRQIADLRNWKKWHPVFTIDAARITSYDTTGAQKNSICTIMHLGKQISIRLLSADTTSVKFLVQSAGEDDIENDVVLSPLKSQHAVQVEWRATTMLHWYPWDKFYGIFIDKLTGPGYESALNSLKEYIERTR